MIVVIIAVAVLALFPTVRCAVLHPFKLVYYTVKDVVMYVYKRKWNLCPTGNINCYTGIFGEGKTLSMVHVLTRLYRKYNGKTVYNEELKKFVKQRVLIVTNVKLLTVPSEMLRSLKQIVRYANISKDYDKENNTLTVIIVGIDEAGAQLNSRDFRDNIDAVFLNTLLTCRHFHMRLDTTSQRFCIEDALIRQVTRHVIACKKLWRFQRQYVFDAWQAENATDVSLLKPIKTACWFVEDKDYNAYNTHDTVGELMKDCENGRMLTATEILALQQNPNSDNNDNVTSPSRKLKKAWKKRR